MGDYTYLWKQIDSRLSAAFRLLSAAVPDAASRIARPLREWLDHNELELALDELVAIAEDLQAPLPRRFREELLVAAMLMRLPTQFRRLSGGIADLEPHVLASASRTPHLCCDFNGFIEPDVYLLDAVCTALDAARLNLLLAPALRVVLYDADSDSTGEPNWLLADAELSEYAGYGIVARVTPGSYRWIQRQL